MNKFEIKNIISSLHRREDFSLVEKLAKIVENNMNEIESLKEEVVGFKRNLKEFVEVEQKIKRLTSDLHKLENKKNWSER